MEKIHLGPWWLRISNSEVRLGEIVDPGHVDLGCGELLPGEMANLKWVKWRIPTRRILHGVTSPGGVAEFIPAKL